MFVVSGERDESARDASRWPGCRPLGGWLLGVLWIAACAEAPGGTSFFDPADSAIITPDLDAGVPSVEPPAMPGGGSDAEPIPTFPTLDASMPLPQMDASQPRPPADAGPDTSRPPPVMMDVGPPPAADAMPDGAPPGPEASMPPPGTCATTPAFATPDNCTKCICMRCATQVQNCYASGDSAKNQQCKQVRDCALQNSCTGTNCYCSDPLCFNPGPCATVIDTAAAPLTATEAGNDLENPVGRSNAVGMCSMSSCASECGL